MDTISVVHARTGFRRFAAPLAGVLLGAALVIAGLIFVQPASAFDYTAGLCSWANPVGGSNVNFPASGDPCEIRWGVSTGSGQSGYRFNPTPPPGLTGLNPGDAFNLGQFTHFNAPISSGTSITQVDLSLQVFLSGFNGGISPTFTFRFSHFETPNNPAGGICAGTGIPTPPEGCPDIVTFPSAFPTETFTFEDVVYTLQLIGFGPDANNLTSSFISPEGGTNNVFLWARITARQIPHVGVPEPSSLALLALGLGMVGWHVTRRRQMPVGLS